MYQLRNVRVGLQMLSKSYTKSIHKQSGKFMDVLSIKLYDSILMWSYYNKHEGVCLGLNMDHVAKYINTNYGMMVTIQGRDVQYRDIINKPDYYRNQEDFFSYQVYTKAKAWEHEQEVRLFIFKPTPWFMKLLPFQHDKTEFNHKRNSNALATIGAECFESLYLGVRIDSTNKEKNHTTGKDVKSQYKIYQMEADPNAFSLIAKQEMNYNLNDYIDLFSDLHTNKQQGKMLS